MKTLKEKNKHPRLRKTIRTKKVTQRKLSSSPVCLLCLQEPGDPEKLGEFLQKDNLCVHYFCLILSSRLPQKGQPNRGLHGFMPEDIKREAVRASKKNFVWHLICRSALYARKKELLSDARMISVSRTSICLVAKKGVAFHSFLESTNHIVENIDQHRTSTRGVWGRKAVSCVAKIYPEQVLRTSRAHAVVKLSITASVSRNMPTHQQSTSSSVPSATTEKSSHRRC
uniref:PHD finger protein 7 n=1 Tax=Mus musculus TaxID=10090 RepID=A0A2I3BRU3_MOUSE